MVDGTRGGFMMSKIKSISFIIIGFLLFLPVLIWAGTIQLPQTGQTKCYDSAGTEIVSSSVFSATSFKITDLGTLGGSWSRPYDINNSGEVVGSACTDGDCNIHHAFLYSDQMMIDLGTLGEPWSKALFINDSGKICGHSFTPWDPNDPYAPYVQRSFLYDNSILIDLGTLGGSFVQVAGINGVGQIVGSAGTTDPDSPCDDLRAFLYSGGNMIPLIPGENVVSRATGINDLGQIIGYAHVAPPPPGYSSPCYFDNEPFFMTMEILHILNPLAHI